MSVFRMTLRSVTLAAAIGAVASIGCADKVLAPEPPEPGRLTVQLTTPNAGDAAIMLRITGPAEPGDVRAEAAAHLLHHRAGSNGVAVAVFGALESGALLTFSVPDMRRVADYAVTIQEVADDSNALRAELTGYTAVVRR